MEAKIEHVSVILPVSNDPVIIGSVSSRKSLKRHWNQLSRFQKNLACIVLAGVCIFYIIFFMLPFDEPSRSSEAIDPMEHIQIAPFKERHERFASSIVKEVKLTDSLANPPTEEAKPVAQQQPEETLMQLEIVRDEPKEIVDNEENVLEENRRVPFAGAKDFKGPTNDRQRAVVQATLHSWKGYKEYAWGHDNLKPISMGYSDWFGLGLTLIDSLDTLYIMDLQDEFDEARAWVDKYLKFDVNREVNLFEITIRVVGGLLSAYHLSGDRMFLDKAIDLGNRLLPSFDSPSGIPFSDVNIGSLTAHAPKWSPDSSTSEVTTIQLEFRDLSRASENPIFENVAAKVNLKIHELEKNEGLVPIFINANTGHFRNFATVSLGARADSYYEYLLKQWLQTGKKNDDYLIEDYQQSIRGVLNQLVRTTPNEKHVYVGELINGKDFKPKMDHLTCYLPGTLLLGYKNGMPKTHLRLATDLLETCYQTYMKQPTQLAPEISYFNVNGESETDIYVKTNDAHNLLRPEFIESLYYFYAITGNRTYQDMGWTIFEAFNRYTKVKNGYTSIGNVKNPLNTRPRDMMESFWLGETLKYFYLLFSDDRNEIDLDKYVFNSEAHPLPIRDG
ncbi:endoplasmic reticulum mannosyl-oligosaccharide 1,2-alpha-mannosidase [Anopheles ziemanni]|uniref:endoplasmic reticulum mannosyl-oligosaccharide 1,2-alpha-mannosidase n=1 Tax=Anopheles coustani TaxID=139045 RepID=UPI002658EC8F|nr:endoplasmic reticulum mannosyl-oligosaccharide 1,2-alpha-mannosidase [Anopheles coustani]XP_058174168.1 endoplasmic reticulum mannosyl-oligosaccharide 1,2-alpha-mannosidase [Anopheles ziemanni]